MKYTPNIRGRRVRLMLLSARPMVVISGFYESHEPPPLDDAHSIVPAHRDGYQNGQQSGHNLHLCFVCCRPGNCRGDTEPVVARWRHPVASGEALVMLHWVMPHAAIEMACGGGAFVRCCRLFCLT
jgi:hypothetical protein